MLNFFLFLSLFLFLYQALFIHFSLAGVIFKRETWQKEHKPQVWSGPNLCYDKDGNNKFVSLGANSVDVIRALNTSKDTSTKVMDQYQYPSNCPPTPTPPLTQRQSNDNKLGTMLGGLGEG